MRRIFQGSAFLAIVILGLMSLFLLVQGGLFLGQYKESLRFFRLSGLEYVDILRESRAAHNVGLRQLNAIRSDALRQGQANGEIFDPATLAALDRLRADYARAISPLEDLIRKKTAEASRLRERFASHQALEGSLAALLERKQRAAVATAPLDGTARRDFSRRVRQSAAESAADPDAIRDTRALLGRIETEARLDKADRRAYLALLDAAIERTREQLDRSKMEAARHFEAQPKALVQAHDQVVHQIEGALAGFPQASLPEALQRDFERFLSENRRWMANMEPIERAAATWSAERPMSPVAALSAFLGGRAWIPNSFRQERFGLLPLLAGTLQVTCIALFIAVPCGVAGAFYASRFAGPRESRALSTLMELIATLPTVLIGFFGIMVLGDWIGDVSAHPWLAWLPFFPIQERLNAFTAGLLLAIMATPTIFTLAGAAIERVPRHTEEASLALGGSLWQTLCRVTLPTAASGIAAAVIIGFGRVMGETMIVLLCAGNRLKIPDWGAGVSTLFEPVHTMPGIIGQEMGEVVQQSLHFQALFMVAIALFASSLLVHLAAFWVIRRFNPLANGRLQP